MNFILSIHMIVIQNLAKKGHDSKFKVATMPIYVKTFKQLLFQNHWADFANNLHEAYGATPPPPPLYKIDRIVAVGS